MNRLPAFAVPQGVAGVISHLIDLLLSERCSLCGELLTAEKEWNYPLCPACVDELPVRGGNLCSVCSTRLISEKGICTRCREREYAFSSNYSLFLYDGKTRELISRFKTHNCKSLASFFASKMAALIALRYSGFTVVPVPFRRSRKRSRGWDQIEAICRSLRKTYGITWLPLLKRSGVYAQKSLDYRGRLGNLEGNIHVRKRRKIPDRVLLIDDVFTTGATADACAATLLQAGAREIRVLTVALDQ